MPGMSDDPRVFCLVAAERADELLPPLRAHFAEEPEVAVLVERRTSKRPAQPSELRPRAPVAERDPARALPPALRPAARHLRLVQPLEPVRRTYEDADLADLVDAALAGEPEAVSELWWRVSERVQTRLRMAIGVFAAERATSRLLGRLLDELPGYDPEREPLTVWLDVVVDRFCAERIPA
jgi:hypothetical protein